MNHNDILQIITRIMVIIVLMIILMIILMVSLLQETDGVLLESYLIYEPEHQVNIMIFALLLSI